MDKKVRALTNLDAVDGMVYGRYNKVAMVNPYKCYFIVTYENGTIQKGNNLFVTGWDAVSNGIRTLQYKLSTGHLITIPKMRGYLPTIEVSESVDGFKMFHAINVNCMTYEDIITYRIILREDNLMKYKIGDIIVSKSKNKIKSSQWKFSI